MPTLCIAPLLDAYFRRRFAAAGLVEASVPLDDGTTTVHCWRFPPGADGVTDARPVLVLLHGFGPPATWQWRRQVGPLSRRFRLVVPDLLFFGGSSSTSEAARVSEAHQAEAVAKLVAAVVPAGAAARVSVAGTSYGGFVAYHVARLLGPGAVERVVIASSDLLKADADDRALLRRGGAVTLLSAARVVLLLRPCSAPHHWSCTAAAQRPQRWSWCSARPDGTVPSFPPRVIPAAHRATGGVVASRAG